jgi:2-hydroxychromene-2-carboxylate isomerase
VHGKPLAALLPSLRSLLMPAITQRWLSRERLLKARARSERSRRARDEPHRLRYFHQVDDPYSSLMAATLPALLARHDVQLLPQLASPPPDAAAPDRERLVAYSRRDAALLAAHHGLDFRDPGHQPAPEAVARVTAQLLAAIEDGRFADVAGPLSSALWQGGAASDLRQATAAQVSAHLAAADAERTRLGHYLGATVHYGGEWTWGIDRLHHLEQRLQALGAQRAGVSGLMFPPDADLAAPVALGQPPAIDFFFSLRSPYSAIVTPRVFALGRLTGAPVRLRYVLPMVMRGLPVPRAKRVYISTDAAREAFVRQIPFGRLNDPVGRPVERGLSLMPLAERQGRGADYVQSFMHGVWAEGLDAGSDRGLRRIAERAGLSWADALQALDDPRWRATAEANRVELLGLGLWGVPSFRVGSTAVWGQDRLWAVQQALLESSSHQR